MDQHGIIIASTDESRIGQTHNMAIEAIQNGSTTVVRVSGNGMKPGVNAPIYYQEKICGVFGISGNPDETITFVQLVKRLIELMIEQEAAQNIRRVSQQLKAQYLNEWVWRHTTYSDNFISDGERYGVQVNKPRCIAIIRLSAPLAMESRLHTFYENNSFDDYCLHITATRYVLILNTMQPVSAQLSQVLDLAPSAQVAVGEPHEIIFLSLTQAQAAIRLGPLLYPDRQIFHYADVWPFDAMLYGMTHSENYRGRPEDRDRWFTEGDAQLLKTFLAFVNHSGEMGVAAKNLHIHRNTLSYRLEKIRQLTGRDPTIYIDAFLLLCDYVLHKTDQRADQPKA